MILFVVVGGGGGGGGHRSIFFFLLSSCFSLGFSGCLLVSPGFCYCTCKIIQVSFWRNSGCKCSAFVNCEKSKVTGIGLYYIVGQSDVLEKRWLQSSFRGAVQFHRMQSKCSKLDKQLGDLSDERSRLEKNIREIEASSPSTSEDRSSELSSHLFASRLVGHGRLFHSLPVAATSAVSFQNDEETLVIGSLMVSCDGFTTWLLHT